MQASRDRCRSAILEIIMIGSLWVGRRGAPSKVRFDHVGDDGSRLGEIEGGDGRILADYFGSIPQAELLKSVARRIVDRRVLHLIKMWLESPMEETDDRGRKARTTAARDNRRGSPPGSPSSPLLANLC